MSAPLSFIEPPRRSRFRRVLIRLATVLVLVGAVAGAGAVLYQASSHTAQAGPTSDARSTTPETVVAAATDPFTPDTGTARPSPARAQPALAPLDGSRAAAV